jgi:DEAD/DEAH box helicase domain-containing protein
VDPDNLHILRPHVRAAAYELPLADSDTRYFGLGMAMVLKELEEQGEIRAVGSRRTAPNTEGPTPNTGPWVYSGASYPAGDINIRSASGDQFNIVEAGSHRVLGTVEIENVFYTIHPGAVYLHQGEAFLVEELDVSTKTAWATHTEVNYYTQPRENNSVEIVSAQSHRRTGRTQSHFGTVTVTNHVIGYRRKQLYTESIVAVEDLDLPPLSFDTEALWFVIPSWALEELERDRVDIAGGLHAIEHATIGLMPLYAMCDRNDVGGVSYPMHPELGMPACFVYDAHVGGVGIAERCYEMLEALLRATRDAIASCPCQEGCPSCIQSPKCGNNNEPLDKAAALRILGMLLD